MTYEEIMAKLSEGERRAVADALDDETECLLADRFKSRGRREGPKARMEREAHALADARSYFAEDVSQFLAGERDMTPIVVLNHRRRVVVAWAVAEILNPTTVFRKG